MGANFSTGLFARTSFAAALAMALASSACARRPPPETLEHQGRARTFVLHAPPRIAGRLPLLLAFHGRHGAGASQARLAGLDAIADAESFFVAYPDGIDESWADARGTTPASEQGVDDVGFVRALLDHLLARHPIDARRVYATGMSNGAMFVHGLGCVMADRIAAIAPVDGLFPGKLVPGCAPSRPLPVILFFGTLDSLMPYGGGELQKGAGGRVLSAEATRAQWAALAGCAGEPEIAIEPDVDPEDGTRVRRAACRGAAEVVLYSVEGGGHTWPGGWQYLPELIIGKTSRDLDASAMIWRFFAKAALPAPAQ